MPKRLRSHLKTKYSELDSSRCQACWKCVESCPNHVLGKVVFLRHRHARIDHAEACKGCKKCVRSCPYDAIRYTYIPLTHALANNQVGCSSSRVTLGS
jgi:ferredoxin